MFYNETVDIWSRAQLYSFYVFYYADATNSLKTSVSNGKSTIASAITDKGVSTSVTATFDTMVSNIRSLSTLNYITLISTGDSTYRISVTLYGYSYNGSTIVDGPNMTSGFYYPINYCIKVTIYKTGYSWSISGVTELYGYNNTNNAIRFISCSGSVTLTCNSK